MNRQFTTSLAACLFSILLVSGCADTGIGDPCSPEVVPEGGYHESEMHIELQSLQCRTRACLVYNQQSFCTARCASDVECNAEWYEDGPGQDGVSQAYCEAPVQLGAESAQGMYCVPSWASKDH